jgi:hypothetical protein
MQTSGPSRLTYPELLELRDSNPEAALKIDFDEVGQLHPGTSAAEGYRWQAVCFYASGGKRDIARRLAVLGTFDPLQSGVATYFLCELAIHNIDCELNAFFATEARALIRELAREHGASEEVALLRMAVASFVAHPNGANDWTDLATHITDINHSSFRVFVLMYRLAEARGWLEHPTLYRHYFERILGGFTCLRHRGPFGDQVIEDLSARLASCS